MAKNQTGPSRIDMRGELQIVHLPIDELIPYARNSRTHSDAQIAQIAGSMREFGWTSPVLLDENHGIIAGHGRILAARKLKLKDSIPCIVLSGMSEAQKRALVLADNKLAMNAGWDTEMLVQELGDIASDGFDLSIVGFSEDELAAMLGGAAPGMEGDEDDEPTPPVIPVTVEGDLWILGRHRLLCGDSTNPDHVTRVMNGAEADFCFTSPPYGQQRKYELEEGISDWDALMQGVFSIIPLKPTAQLLVNLGLVHRESEWVPYWDNWIEFMRKADWKRFGWYVWDQGCGLQGDFGGRLAPSHEFVFHFRRERGTVNRTVPKKPENIRDKSNLPVKSKNTATFRTVNSSPKAALNTHKIPDSVIRIGRHRGGLGDAGAHPAVFPVDLVSQMLTTFTNPDDTVYEPFSGSGTSIISAQKNGRNACAIDVAPAYVDVAIKRWQNFTGQLAIHEDGRTFPEVDQARMKP